GNELVTPILEKQLKKGARIVAHDFEFTAWTPVQSLSIDDDGEGRSPHLYLYRRSVTWFNSRWSLITGGCLSALRAWYWLWRAQRPIFEPLGSSRIGSQHWSPPTPC